MSNYPPDNSENELRRQLEFAGQLLDAGYLPPMKRTFDERDTLFVDTINIRRNFEQSMYRIAQEAGIALDESITHSWQPNKAQYDTLRKWSERPRKRLRMIEGAIQFEKDLLEVNKMHGVPLRDYQIEPIKDFKNFLLYATRTTEHGGKSGIIEMPTGTGKTGIFANIAAMLKHGEHPNEPVRVLVLVPTQDILNQTMGRQGERGFGKFAPHLDVGGFYQYARELEREVVVMTTTSFNRLMERGNMPHFDAVIVDEAHTVLGDTTAQNIQTYCRDKIAVGLTATPEYDEERSAYKLFKHKIHEMKFKPAVRSGKLAPVRGHLRHVEADYDKFQLPSDPAARQRAKRRLNLHARTRYADKIIEQALARGVGVLVRCPAGDDIDFAVQYAAYLRTKYVPNISDTGYRSIWAEHVGGSAKRQDIYDRQEIYSIYNSGDGDVLTYVKAIGMGWDSPHAKVLINLAPTTSAVEMRQAIGRIMRLVKDANGDPVEAEVWDFEESLLGRRQYTCLHALESKSGELIAHDPDVNDPIIPAPKRFNREQTPDVVDIRTRNLGEVAIQHSEDAILPGDIEVKATINAFKGNRVPLEDASRILGVSLPTLKSVLLGVGSNPATPLPKDELLALIELFPHIYTEDLPETGYISVRDFSRLPNMPVRMLSVIPFARRNGITPYRFRNKEGVVGFYFDNASAARLLKMIGEGKYRRVAGYQYKPPQN